MVRIMSTMFRSQYTVPQQPNLVLSVEDDPTAAALIGQLIARRPDLTLMATTHGCTGVRLARANHPAVILMDINLPDLKGTDVLEFLRNDPTTVDIPIVAISSEDESRSPRSKRTAGFFAYLSKPFKIDDFLATIDAALLHASALEAARRTASEHPVRVD
jgi:CheY-like chemotaxis protein